MEGMTFKEFLVKLKETFFSAVLNAVGSTTFWVMIVAIVLSAFKVIGWEAALATVGIYGVKRIGQDVTANMKGK
jgi:hypothetical protein